MSDDQVFSESKKLIRDIMESEKSPLGYVDKGSVANRIQNGCIFAYNKISTILLLSMELVFQINQNCDKC